MFLSTVLILLSLDENEDVASSEVWKRAGKMSMGPTSEEGGLFQASDRWTRGGSQIVDVRWVFDNDVSAAAFLTSSYGELSDGFDQEREGKRKISLIFCLFL